MKVISAAVLSVVALSICMGCGKKQNSEPEIKTLLSSTDIVLTRNFYDPVSFVGVARPKEVEGPYKITTTWTPGKIDFQPVIAYKPHGESTRIKGILVHITQENFNVDGRMGSLVEHSSILDLDEAKDLDSALSYLKTMGNQWGSSNPSHYVETSFQSKDDFTAAIFWADNKVQFKVTSGNADLDVPATSIASVQGKLRQALNILDQN